MATLFGSGIKRREDPRLVTGRGTFVDDVKLPGMTFLAILRSPLCPRAHRAHRHPQGAQARRRRGCLHGRRHRREGQPGTMRLEPARLRPQGAATSAARRRHRPLRGRRRRDGCRRIAGRRARCHRPHRRGVRRRCRWLSIPRRRPRRARRGSMRRCPPTWRSRGRSPAATPRRRSPSAQVKVSHAHPSAAAPADRDGAPRGRRQLERGLGSADDLGHEPESAHPSFPLLGDAQGARAQDAHHLTRRGRRLREQDSRLRGRGAGRLRRHGGCAAR